MNRTTTEQLMILRHSAAHLLAHAVSELYPETIFAIGPATEDGFFYDMLPQASFKEVDLAKIEMRMHEISQRNLAITHTQISKEEARKIFAHNKFKLELIDLIPDATVGLSRQGDFIDLCRGGHVASTREINHFKLVGISGSYWRANKENDALQRISGIVFFTAEELAQYQKMREEAALYDHRTLGTQLDLFSFHEEGPGFPFFHPKGKLVINTLIEDLRKRLMRRNYQEIGTPVMLSDELWRRSGHYAHYHDKMYFCIVDEKSYALRPMNCPGSLLVYKTRPRSYRELPLKLSEFGAVHRYELSGVLHGLFRVRAFTIDDGHIYCTPDQVQGQVAETIDLIYEVLQQFPFKKVHVAISTRPESSIGTDELWEKATNALKNALHEKNISFSIKEGEGAFYGPKIEFIIEDTFGRSWQCSTVQVDFFQPENFDLTYVSNTGAKERPVMIHRAIYGSLERFFGVLLEQSLGHLPAWLAPVQVRALPITDAQLPYAQEITHTLQSHGLRVEADGSSDTLASKIKSAQLEKIPYMIVLGKKEVAERTVTIRSATGTQEQNVPIEDAIKKIIVLCSQKC